MCQSICSWNIITTRTPLYMFTFITWRLRSVNFEFFNTPFRLCWLQWFKDSYRQLSGRAWKSVERRKLCKIECVMGGYFLFTFINRLVMDALFTIPNQNINIIILWKLGCAVCDEDNVLYCTYTLTKEYTHMCKVYQVYFWELTLSWIFYRNSETSATHCNYERSLRVNLKYIGGFKLRFGVIQLFGYKKCKNRWWHGNLFKFGQRWHLCISKSL